METMLIAFGVWYLFKAFIRLGLMFGVYKRPKLLIVKENHIADFLLFAVIAVIHFWPIIRGWE